MTPSHVMQWALGLCVVLLVGVCAAWVLDHRRTAPGRRSELGTSVLAVFGVVAVETSGIGFLSGVVGTGTAGYTRLLETLFVPYVELSAVAVVLMVVALVAGVLSAVRRSGRGAWRVLHLVLAAAALASLWISERTLASAVHLDVQANLIFAPTAGAATLTAVLLARFVAALISGGDGKLAVSIDSQATTGEAPAQVANASDELSLAGVGRVVDVTPYQRPGS